MVSLSDHLSQTLLEAENQQLRQRAEAAERERDAIAQRDDQCRRDRDRYKRLAIRWRKQAYFSDQEAESYREWGRQIRNGDIDPRRDGPFGPW